MRKDKLTIVLDADNILQTIKKSMEKSLLSLKKVKKRRKTF